LLSGLVIVSEVSWLVGSAKGKSSTPVA